MSILRDSSSIHRCALRALSRRSILACSRSESTVAIRSEDVTAQAEEVQYSSIQDASLRQVMLDIRRAVTTPKTLKTDVHPVDARGSAEAEFGRKRLGSVELPEWLDGAIRSTLEDYDKNLLRVDTERILHSLRSTTGYTQLIENDKRVQDSQGPALGPSKSAIRKFRQIMRDFPVDPHVLTYGEREVTAYIAGFLPVTYGPIYNVLRELRARVPDLSPRDVLDFGTGPGTAIWAAHEIFGNTVANVVGIDVSEAMISMAERLLEPDLGPVP